MPPRLTIKIGDKFDRLTVQSIDRVGMYGFNILCKCKCGTLTHALQSNLLKRNKRSCGCLQREPRPERRIKGAMMECGKKMTPEYRAWCAMKTRCSNENEPSWERYGARGIKVCKKWLNDFPAFLADMGPRPSPKHSLDRKNNDGDYTPRNCRWATAKEQARNRKSTRLIHFNGRQMSFAEACEMAAVDYGAAKYRADAGLPFDQPRRGT